MTWAAFQKIQPLVLIFFIVLSVILGVICLLLGTKNMMLQSQLLVNKENKIEVIVDTTEIANALSKGYSESKIEREIIYEKIKGDTETIVKHDTVFLNVCISDDGMQHYNNFVSSPVTGKPE
ncbi:MAG: hypothetical protein KIG60_01020 [Caryophanon sp.]|nr:hypothetical protein [Caryophanon sp.]